MVKDLTVAQNFMLMEEPLNLLGMIRGRALEDRVRASARGNLASAPSIRAPRCAASICRRGRRSRLRAPISHKPRILLLDEPTSSLSGRDVQWLGDLIQRLKQSGTTVVLISHRMQEVREFCSALTIFRNGRTVGAYAMAELTDAEIIDLMIGRSIGAAFPPKPQRIGTDARARRAAGSIVVESWQPPRG